MNGDGGSSRNFYCRVFVPSFLLVNILCLEAYVFSKESRGERLAVSTPGSGGFLTPPSLAENMGRKPHTTLAKAGRQQKTPDPPETDQNPNAKAQGRPDGAEVSYLQQLAK